MAEEKERNLRLYGLMIIPVEDDDLWREAARIKSRYTLSLADAFAAATAKVFESKLIVGSDKEYREINIQLLKIRE